MLETAAKLVATAANVMRVRVGITVDIAASVERKMEGASG
jgi:hypothetical protein